MKFSALILLAFLPVAISKKVDYMVRSVSTSTIPLTPEQKIKVNSQIAEVKKEVLPELQAISDEVTCSTPPCRALAGQDRLDTKMVKVEEAFAPELPTPADPVHRALRGQNRELATCASYCIGQHPDCWVSFLCGLRQQLCKRS